MRRRDKVASMKTKLCAWNTGLFSILFALAAVSGVGLRAEEVKLKLMSSGAVKKLGGYMPQRLSLSETRPPGLKQAPEGLAKPLYGELKLGPKDAPTTFLVILDEPEGKPSRLWVDANANGNLMDDAAPEWTGN